MPVHVCSVNTHNYTRVTITLRKSNDSKLSIDVRILISDYGDLVGKCRAE